MGGGGGAGWGRVARVSEFFYLDSKSKKEKRIFSGGGGDRVGG